MKFQTALLILAAPHAAFSFTAQSGSGVFDDNLQFIFVIRELDEAMAVLA